MGNGTLVSMKTIFWIVIIAAIGYFGFTYLTRPVAQPTSDISTQTTEDQLPTESSATQYRVASSDSMVQFAIKETLNGKPFTAVGTTNQISGDVSIKNADTVPEITMGVVKVDARTLKTDSEKRDGAINRFILKTETAGNEYIVFTPKSITNLTDSSEDGAGIFEFTVNGDLTISGVTKSTSFIVEAILSENGTTLTSTMKGILKRSDYNLNIPEIPFVANVSDTLDISGTVVAKKI